jgi:tRNA(Glu) U13 pseudouridine synthase TruD
MRLGNFSYCNEQLRLGSLRGNEFRLLMRGVVLGPGSEEDKV